MEAEAESSSKAATHGGNSMPGGGKLAMPPSFEANTLTWQHNLRLN